MAADDPEETTNRALRLEPPKPVPVPRGSSAYLVVISGPSFGEMHKLKGDRTVLGRSDKADIRIVDDGISREHAAVVREGGSVAVVDLGSTNGTFCNGSRVQHQELSDGDKVAIGSST